MKLRPYETGDEAKFQPRADCAEQMHLNAWDWAKGAPGPTWTLEESGQVLGIGGVIMSELGAALAWACIANLSARQWPETVYLAGVTIDEILSRPEVRWLWAQCRADWPAAGRVLRKLGFAEHHLEPCAPLGCEILCMLREG